MRSRVVLVAVAQAIVACADDGNSDTNEFSVCETAWYAEEGDDYGDPWVPPEAPDWGTPLLDQGSESDTGTALPDMPIGSLPDSLIAPPHDEGSDWLYDVDSGTYYRRPTTLEARENGLREEALLLIVPRFTREIDAGLREARIGLPVPDPETTPDQYDVVEFRFDYVGETPPVARLERGPMTSDVPMTWTQFPFYATPGARTGTTLVAEDQAIGRLVAGSDGHASIRAAIGRHRFTLSGPLNLDFTEVPTPLEVFGSPVYKLAWEFEEREHAVFDLILPPATDGSSGIVHPTKNSQCTDLFDNDGDGVGDHCDLECIPHENYAGPPGVIPIYPYEATKSFGLFGDLLYCSSNKGWDVELAAIGMEAAQILNWVDQGADGDGIPPFRLVNIACDVRNVEEAEACHGVGGIIVSSDCPGDLADYPLASAFNDFGFHYLPNVWNLVDWYVDGQEAAPMHVAVVVGIEDGLNGAHNNLAGIAFFVLEPETLEDFQQEGAAVINIHRYGGYLNTAHEIGHTMGLPHDTGEYAPTDSYKIRGLMNRGAAGSAPILGPVHPDEAETWWGANVGFIDKTPPGVWQEFVKAKSWPRPSGFGYTGEG